MMRGRELKSKLRLRVFERVGRGEERKGALSVYGRFVSGGNNESLHFPVDLESLRSLTL